MTCDSGRPCQRCTQRGLEKTCEDAPRKRKKYLEDVPNQSLDSSLANSQSQSQSQSQPPIITTTYQPQVPIPNHTTYQATMFQHSSTAPNLNQPVPDYYFSDLQHQKHQMANKKTSRTNFLSTAADLEYSTLSNILQENFGPHTTSNEGTPNSHNFSPALSPNNVTNGNGLNSNRMASGDQIQSINQIATTSPYSRSTSNLYDHHQSNRPKCDESINQYYIGKTESDQVVYYPDIITIIEEMKKNDPVLKYEENQNQEPKQLLSFTIGILPEDNNSNSTTSNDSSIYKEPEEIYANVKKPFSYTPGYHSLIAYLRRRFPKEMLVKMAESMASYRPSFIACTNSLKEHDLIFMEQCFQRTLLTSDNFIKISGTPTIVWRRTGEIAYVGNEFCILTGWKREDLIGKDKRKFIVELLDDKSVLGYFEVFSRIAFGDFLGATMTECTLLTPQSDVKIETGCMWTLKRDVFGIPMMIVGNFLPIIK